MSVYREIIVRSRIWWLEVALGVVSIFFACSKVMRYGYWGGGGKALEIISACIGLLLVIDGFRRSWAPNRWMIEDDGAYLRISKNGHVRVDGEWTAFRFRRRTAAVVEFDVSPVQVATVPAVLFSFDQLRKMQESKGGEPGATDNPDDAQRLREDH